MELAELIMLFGIPSAITGFAVWILQRKFDEREKKSQEREDNLEDLMMLMMRTTRANTVGITAIAKAIQRIPDAHCNGDMTAALAEMEEIQENERTFLEEKGIKHIFE